MRNTWVCVAFTFWFTVTVSFFLPYIPKVITFFWYLPNKDVTQGKINAWLVQEVFVRTTLLLSKLGTSCLAPEVAPSIISQGGKLILVPSEGHWVPPGCHVCSSQDCLTESNAELSKTYFIAKCPDWWWIVRVCLYSKHKTVTWANSGGYRRNSPRVTTEEAQLLLFRIGDIGIPTNTFNRKKKILFHVYWWEVNSAALFSGESRILIMKQTIHQRGKMKEDTFSLLLHQGAALLLKCSAAQCTEDISSVTSLFHLPPATLGLSVRTKFHEFIKSAITWNGKCLQMKCALLPWAHWSYSYYLLK